jgi:uncharacterized protein (TIGR02217 family)
MANRPTNQACRASRRQYAARGRRDCRILQLMDAAQRAGIVTFAAGLVATAGVAVTAGFNFDVPVRFGTYHLEVDLSAFAAGAIPRIPLVEIRV